MISWVLLVIAFAGLCLSLYVYHVEQYAGKKKGYHAACDINDKSSCTKAFSSSYGNTFGISNGTWGMLFYLVAVVLALLGEVQWIFLLSVLSVLGSFYLAYILYFKIKTFCVVCTSIYAVNVLLALSAYLIAF